MKHNLNGNLYDAPLLTDVVNIGGVNPEKVLTNPSSNPVEFRFHTLNLKHNNSIFKKVTLQPNEIVSLKFKTKGSAGASILEKAQMFINELTQ